MTGLWTIHPYAACKGDEMGYIRPIKLKKGGERFQAEIRLKGHPTLTAMFDRKTDAKAWVQKIEADIRCGRHQLYVESKRHTFLEAVERYLKEQSMSIAKRGHLDWWKKELGPLYLQDVRPAIINEKKQKLLADANKKGKIRSKRLIPNLSEAKYQELISKDLEAKRRGEHWVYRQTVVRENQENSE